MLITGASSGVGMELARLAAADGKDLVLVARREETLRALAEQLTKAHGVKVAVIPADLGAPGGARRLFDEVQGRGLAIDELINCAGYGVTGPFLQTDLAAELGMIQLNLTVLTELTKLFLPAMVGRGRGRVMNVASTAAFVPGPYMSIYYATKAFVLSFTEALAYELKGSGMTVTALCPGPFASGFQARSGLKLGFLMRLMRTEAPFVAAAGYRAMQRGRVVVVPGLVNQLSAFCLRFAPRPVLRAVGAGANAGAR